jgi:hypothetical protein
MVEQYLFSVFYGQCQMLGVGLFQWPSWWREGMLQVLGIFKMLSVLQPILLCCIVRQAKVIVNTCGS